MKRYPHIIAKVYNEPWLITKNKHLALQRLLESRLDADGEAKAATGEDEDEDFEPKPVFEDRTAIIPVHGIIGRHLSGLEMMCGGCDLDYVLAMVDQVHAERLTRNLRRLVFDFRTPGGTVAGVPESAAKIAAINWIETVAFTDTEACSAGYWLASQCKEFFASESADVGSIGVYMAMLDRSREMEDRGIKMNAISAGKFKLAGAYFKPMTDDERQMFQRQVDAIHANFKKAVTRNREIDDAHMQGQVFSGEEAASLGLTSGIVNDITDLII